MEWSALIPADFTPLLVSQFWQVTALLAVLLPVVRYLSSRNPRVAYMICLLMVIKCLTPPVFASPSGLFCWLNREYSATKDVQAADPIRTNRVTIEPVTVREIPSRAVPVRDDPEISTSIVHSAPLPLVASVPTKMPKAVATETFGEKLPSPRVLLTVCWLIGVAIALFVGIGGYLIWSWRTRLGAQEPDPEWQDAVDHLAKRLRLRCRVRLLVTSRNTGPAVVGLFRPTILLPELIVRQNSAEKLEPILAHELLHVRRGDLWVGLLQVAAQSLWWFHPLVWLASKQLSRQIERCCDEQVVAELRCKPARYARSLLDILEWKRQLVRVPEFPGVRPVDVTFARLERIMSLGHGCRKTNSLWNWGVLLAMALMILPGAPLTHAVWGEEDAQPIPDKTQAAPKAEKTEPSTSTVNEAMLADENWIVACERVQTDGQPDHIVMDVRPARAIPEIASPLKITCREYRVSPATSDQPGRIEGKGEVEFQLDGWQVLSSQLFTLEILKTQLVVKMEQVTQGDTMSADRGVLRIAKQRGAPCTTTLVLEGNVASINGPRLSADRVSLTLLPTPNSEDAGPENSSFAPVLAESFADNVVLIQLRNLNVRVAPRLTPTSPVEFQRDGNRSRYLFTDTVDLRIEAKDSSGDIQRFECTAYEGEILVHGIGVNALVNLKLKGPVNISCAEYKAFADILELELLSESDHPETSVSATLTNGTLSTDETSVRGAEVDWNIRDLLYPNNSLHTKVYPIGKLALHLLGTNAAIDNATVPADRQQAMAAIADKLRATIAPESWKENGGNGAVEVFPSKMVAVVTQTRKVHRAIAEQLGK